MGEVHADNVETHYNPVSPTQTFFIEEPSTVPVRRALIFSTELVLGPAERIWSARKFFFFFLPLSFTPFCHMGRWAISSPRNHLRELGRIGQVHTNGTDDRSAAEVLRRHHLGVKLGVPFQLHAVAQVVERGSGRHFELLDKLWDSFEKQKGV